MPDSFEEAVKIASQMEAVNEGQKSVFHFNTKRSSNQYQGNDTKNYGNNFHHRHNENFDKQRYNGDQFKPWNRYTRCHDTRNFETRRENQQRIQQQNHYRGAQRQQVQPNRRYDMRHTELTNKTIGLIKLENGQTIPKENQSRAEEQNNENTVRLYNFNSQKVNLLNTEQEIKEEKMKKIYKINSQEEHTESCDEGINKSEEQSYELIIDFGKKRKIDTNAIHMNRTIKAIKEKKIVNSIKKDRNDQNVREINKHTKKEAKMNKSRYDIKRNKSDKRFTENINEYRRNKEMDDTIEVDKMKKIRDICKEIQYKPIKDKTVTKKIGNAVSRITKNFTMKRKENTVPTERKCHLKERMRRALNKKKIRIKISKFDRNNYERTSKRLKHNSKRKRITL